MANEALATAAPSEDEYDAFHTALSASARGRAFLAEHGRRQRLADTDMLLGALARLEAQVASPQAEAVGTDLNELTEAIQGLIAEMGASNARMAELAAVVDTLKARFDGTAPAAAAQETPAPVAPAAPPALQALSMPEVSWPASHPPVAVESEPARAVAAKDDVPAPAAISALAFVAELAERDAAARDDEAAQDDVDDESPEATIIKAGAMPTPTPFAGEDFSAAPAVKTVPNTDLLGAIMALSDDERTALFT